MPASFGETCKDGQRSWFSVQRIQGSHSGDAVVDDVPQAYQRDRLYGWLLVQR